MSDEQKQVHDQGTQRMSGDQIANAAAETLHGSRAELETNEQPDAVILPGGGTLVADTTEHDDGTAGKGSLSGKS
jgi:hypothetical protein